MRLYSQLALKCSRRSGPGAAGGSLQQLLQLQGPTTATGRDCEPGVTDPLQAGHEAIQMFEQDPNCMGNCIFILNESQARALGKLRH